MLHPSYNDLMNVANSDVEPGEHPVVNSRYSIVLATAKRARQLIDGKYPKPLSVAIEELSTSAIKINSEEDETEDELMTLDEVSEEKPIEDSEI